MKMMEKYHYIVEEKAQIIKEQTGLDWTECTEIAEALDTCTFQELAQLHTALGIIKKGK